MCDEANAAEGGSWNRVWGDGGSLYNWINFSACLKVFIIKMLGREGTMAPCQDVDLAHSSGGTN